MEIKRLKQLLKIMEDYGLEALAIKDSEEEVSLKKATPGGVPLAPVPQMAVPAAQPAPAESAPAASSGNEIKSPMVGTFYQAPSPESPPFVKEGDKVEVGQVLCIIEAMKLMNEFKSEVSGTITKVLVQDGEPVEFDQPLFLIG